MLNDTRWRRQWAIRSVLKFSTRSRAVPRCNEIKVCSVIKRFNWINCSAACDVALIALRLSSQWQRLLMWLLTSCVHMWVIRASRTRKDIVIIINLRETKSSSRPTNLCKHAPHAAFMFHKTNKALPHADSLTSLRHLRLFSKRLFMQISLVRNNRRI